MPMRHRQIDRITRAFTLIELIVVLVVLAILSAIALPKYLDISKEAHRSATAGVAGGVSEGVSQAILRYSIDETAGLPPDADSNGFPDHLGDTAVNEQTIFDGILDPPLTVKKVGWKPYPLGFPIGTFFIYVYDADGDNIYDWPDEGYIIYNSANGQVFTFVPTN